MDGVDVGDGDKGNADEAVGVGDIDGVVDGTIVVVTFDVVLGVGEIVGDIVDEAVGVDVASAMLVIANVCMQTANTTTMKETDNFVLFTKCQPLYLVDMLYNYKRDLSNENYYWRNLLPISYEDCGLRWKFIMPQSYMSSNPTPPCTSRCRWLSAPARRCAAPCVLPPPSCRRA